MPAHPIDVLVGSNLRRLRTMRGLSQQAIGGALGKTFQQCQKYERGANRMSASVLSELATFMNCAVSDFFEGSPQPPPSEVAHETNRETLEMVRLYNDLDRNARDAVRLTMRALSHQNTLAP